MSAFRDDAWPSKQRTCPPSELHVYIYSSLGQQVHSSSVPCLCPVNKLGQFGDVTRRDPAA